MLNAFQTLGLIQTKELQGREAGKQLQSDCPGHRE